jgi:AcrR family transcriptional regulator
VPASAMPDRRTELLDAIEPVLRTAGPEASMAALAAGAGITKPILYRHFGDKQGLLAAWAERQALRLGQRITSELALERTPRSRIRTTISTYLAALEEDPQGYWFVTRRALSADDPSGGPVGDVAETIVTAVAALLERELAGAGADTTPARTWARAMVGMVQQVGDHWIRHPDVTRDALASQLTDLVWVGFRSMADRPAI